MMLSCQLEMVKSKGATKSVSFKLHNVDLQIEMTLKTWRNLLFYNSLMLLIQFLPGFRVELKNRLRMVPAPQFAHACLRLSVCLS